MRDDLLYVVLDTFDQTTYGLCPDNVEPDMTIRTHIERVYDPPALYTEEQLEERIRKFES